ncbi:bifunctional 5,10-methylenetetrahydrofolate dehydrogenase/5,10-methenyltetrahydrofolate cyclohydrolase [Patescibacteria group bacterium]|nr:bifunctional 5,10-methylenetetrahydrofolate dehydrogenase/5,10-methenyltetrahydrofolate cyclohydrolase [Patescibacteria group bacterium]
MHILVDGNRIAQEIKAKLLAYTQSVSVPISFHIIYVGSDPVIDNFIKYKKAFGESIHVDVTVHHFDEQVTQEDLLSSIHVIALTADAMIVQLPLPSHLDRQVILDAIPAEKDVDVLGTKSRVQFREHASLFFPPVTGSIVAIFDHYDVLLEGKHIVLVGNGSLVGYPTTLWFEREGITYDLVTKDTDVHLRDRLLRNANVVITGAGVPHMITSDMVKEGAVLIDAGTSEADRKIQGDIHPQAFNKALLATPVPGGIGPITIAVLYQNVITAHKQFHDVPR